MSRLFRNSSITKIRFSWNFLLPSFDDLKNLFIFLEQKVERIDETQENYLLFINKMNLNICGFQFHL